VTLRSELRGGKNKTRWYITEIAVGELPARFVLRREALLDVGSDEVIGDPVFDAAFRVDLGGDGLPFLDAETRDVLRRSARFTLGGQILRFEERSRWSAERVRGWVALADRLGERDPALALRQMAMSDPAPRVRVRAMEELAARQPDEGVLAAGLEAESPLVRLGAAILLGRTRELADGLADVDDADRHRALGLLARRGTAEQVVVALASLAGAVPRPLWFAATEAARAHPTPAVLTAVVEALGRMPADAFVVDRALVALTAAPDPTIEPWVLSFVPHADRSREAALDWLAAHGTVAAVPVLDALIAASFPLTDARRDAERAKDAVQGRLVGSAGQLSLAADDARGGLAVARSAAGRLSVREPS
jgi:hypothetical protein